MNQPDQTDPTDQAQQTDRSQQPRRLGEPTYLELDSDDLDGAKAFYGELFGWEFHDQGAELGHYHQIRSGELLVGGAMSTVGMPCPEGGKIPSRWMVFLATDDIEGTCRRAAEAGATVAVSPMSPGDTGRAAVLIDPSGAVVGLWQAGTIVGTDLPRAAGSPVWFELMTKDFDAALPFYREVLGWDVQAYSEEGSDWRYVTNGTGENSVAGMGDAAGVFADDVPSAWRVVLGIADFDTALARIPELGGAVLDGPMDSPYGRLATVRDPQGATFQLLGVPA